jgi:trehalose 6-phosphate synthase
MPTCIDLFDKTMPSKSNKELLIVSNRLPVEIAEDNGTWTVTPSPGGLVTALTPLMRRLKGTWMGWPGCTGNIPIVDLLNSFPNREFKLCPVVLTEEQVNKYYRGFSNKSIWPLFHDLLGQFSYDAENWHAYKQVNSIFASTIMEIKSQLSFLWIHDYQLILVGKTLRELGCRDRLRYFLHIPFPSPDLLRRLPVHLEILDALLSYDIVGFQTPHDKSNFLLCVREFFPEAERIASGKTAAIKFRGRDMLLGNFPISIDFNEFNDDADRPEVEEVVRHLRNNMRAEKIVLGIDRLDYTKGIPERFLAFEKLLQKYPEVKGKVSLLQIVIPSRLNVTEYEHLKHELDTLAGRINGAFTEQGWIPIHYVFRSLDRVQLLGHYRASDIALITPLRDGMNLVSKEYCAASIDNNGILILSEFAGSARQLSEGAILVNPYDKDGTADAIYRALTMSPGERDRRMRLLRSEIRRNNVQRWINWFITEEELQEESEEVLI